MVHSIKEQGILVSKHIMKILKELQGHNIQFNHTNVHCSTSNSFPICFREPIEKKLANIVNSNILEVNTTSTEPG